MKLPKVIMDGIEDFSLRSWTDLGECNIAAIDFNGTLIMNICENYRDKGIIADFIGISTELGIRFEEVRSLPYEQANLRMKSL